MWCRTQVGKALLGGSARGIGRVCEQVAEGHRSDEPAVHVRRVSLDATRLGTWETVELIDQGDGTVGIRLFDRHVLTAVNGGGRSIGAFDTNRSAVSISSRSARGAPRARSTTARGPGPGAR